MAQVADGIVSHIEISGDGCFKAMSSCEANGRGQSQ